MTSLECCLPTNRPVTRMEVAGDAVAKLPANRGSQSKR